MAEAHKRLELRNYQWELARAGLAGQNSVVVAPTGSGKTEVAIQIMKSHFETRRQSGLQSKVAFVVPSVPLVDQQMQQTKSYLGDHLKVGSVQGGDSQEPKAMHLKTNDITVITPQCLLNLFHNQNDLDQIRLEELSLLVFDECHHCAKDHPYMMIMWDYLKRKLEANGDIRSLPQILCLTASLGVGKSDTLEKAVEHVLEKLASMNAQVISTVQEHHDELLTHNIVPTDSTVCLNASASQTGFFSLVSEVMQEIEDQVQPILNIVCQPNSGNLFLELNSALPSGSRDHQAYENWVCTLLNKIPTIDNEDRKRFLMTCLQRLKLYQIALVLYAHIPLKQAIQYLNDSFEDVEARLFNEKDAWLSILWNKLKKALDKLPMERNCLVERLEYELSHQFASVPDSRVIVFVRTREITTQLRQWLRAHPQFKAMGPEQLTGINVADSKGGQSSGEQTQVLKDFRSGNSRILVATTVAEEGLDIQKCNLVIKYNHVTNEIAMVQKRGRGRAEGSRSILIAREHRIATKEDVNRLREELMAQALDIVRQFSKEELAGKIDEIQRKLYNERQFAAEMEALRRSQASKKIFQLLCRTCDELITTSDQMRRVHNCHYVSVEPKIWLRCALKPFNRTQNFYELQIGGKIYCKSCSQERGIVVRYKEVCLAVIKADSFVVKDSSGEKFLCRKWKKVEDRHFLVDPIADKELIQISKQFQSDRDYLAVVEKFRNALL